MCQVFPITNFFTSYLFYPVLWSHYLQQIFPLSVDQALNLSHAQSKLSANASQVRLPSAISVLSVSPVALQLRAPPPKVSARAPAHRSYHFRGVKLKSCIKEIHHNLYISKQANVRIKHADTEGASHKKFGTDARVQLDIYADTAKRKQ